MKNKFNLNDRVKLNKYNDTDEYKIVGLNLDTYNKSKKIWYRLYRLSDGYTCVVAESIIEKV